MQIPTRNHQRLWIFWARPSRSSPSPAPPGRTARLSERSRPPPDWVDRRQSQRAEPQNLDAKPAAAEPSPRVSARRGRQRPNPGGTWRPVQAGGPDVSVSRAAMCCGRGGYITGRVTSGGATQRGSAAEESRRPLICRGLEGRDWNHSFIHSFTRDLMHLVKSGSSRAQFGSLLASRCFGVSPAGFIGNSRGR